MVYFGGIISPLPVYLLGNFGQLATFYAVLGDKLYVEVRESR